MEKSLWRCLEELDDREEFRAYLARYFSGPSAESFEPVARRRFLAMLAASLGLAGLSGCNLQPPRETIMPYARAPEQITPGKPLFYATVTAVGGGGLGLLVRTREGRPIKIEGNPRHPASLGATDVWAQSAVLTLYDPDRSQTLTNLGQIRTRDAAQRAIRDALAGQQKKKGAGLRVLTRAIYSPSLAAQIEGLLADYPQARWHRHEPLGNGATQAGARMALGKEANTVYRLDQAQVVLSLDADFMNFGPGRLRYARDFIDRRRTSARSQVPGNRLYCVECTPSITGGKADHRWPLRADQVETFARAVAAAVAEPLGAVARRGAAGIPRAAFEAVVDELRRHRGQSLVIAGEYQPAAVHGLAHAINRHLGNVGKTVVYTDPIEFRTDRAGSLAELAEDLDRGRVDLLAIVGGNPAYDAPADVEFARRLGGEGSKSGPKRPLRIHLGLYHDETAELCDWHIPEAHFLEAWSDARAFDGTAAIAQPVVAPLYGGLSAQEFLSLLRGQPQRTGYELVRDYWRQKLRPGEQSPGGESFEDLWRTALHEGVIAGSRFPNRELPLGDDFVRRVNEARPADAGKGEFELVLRPDPNVLDGSLSNNPWLQELPRPLTKTCWENVALVSPETAKRLGLVNASGGHGGERGQAAVDQIELRVGDRRLVVPAWILPGQPDDSIALQLGYGRTQAGSVGSDIGADAYRLLEAGRWSRGGLEVAVVGGKAVVACTQFHHSMEDREPVHHGTLDAFRKDPRSLLRHGGGHGNPQVHEEEDPAQMFPLPKYEGYKWGMVIDLTACIGCNSCVVACQAENNIPVVGKEEVTRAREMHWLRIDRYYEGAAGNPTAFFQPVPCMHCETAPCELVCPVAATAHSDEGLNDMVYNRCVGTRYCSNNCPYKVRRFNFLQYADFETPITKLMRNPEVTVRSRGVMEKCSYCVQRILAARITAEKEGRNVRDGEVQTACQAACPTRAITFGDLNDRGSEVALWNGRPHNYGLLADLNTRPRTTYLAEVRNPNPQIES